MRLARKMRLVGGTRAIKATFSKPFMWHLYFHYSSNAGARTDNLVHGMALPEQGAKRQPEDVTLEQVNCTSTR